MFYIVEVNTIYLSRIISFYWSNSLIKGITFWFSTI